ncbi:MAG: HlyD family efflux transporter periplasmic adaptor subunit [Butyrivibrio sp.]|nr:HlyD family efflux transporter periplasmic adaptor subunit [Butyrivibrio sp.]
MKKVTRNTIIAAAAALLAGGGIATYMLWPDSVDVENVIKGDVSQSITEIGQIEADPAVTVYAPVKGKITEVSFKVNDKVKKGDILAKYDLQEAQDRYDLAELNRVYQEDTYNAAVKSNNKNKSKANSAITAADEMLKDYVHIEENRDTISIANNEKNARIAQTRQGIQSEIDRLQAELSFETKKMEEGQSSLEQVEKIKKQITASYEVMATLPTSESINGTNYADYAEYVRQMDLAEKHWSTLNSEKLAAQEKIVNDSQIKSYEDNVKIAQIQEETARKELEKAQNGVISNVSGTVLKRLLDEGAVAEAGTAIFVIQPDSGYKATLMVSRYDIGSVALGQKAKVTMGQTVYDGTVSAISPVATNADASGKPKVKVEISFDDNTVRPTIGLEAQVEIMTQEKKSVLSISDKAVYTGDDGKYVFVLSDGKAQKKSIETGASGNGLIEIVSGLSEGETVITQALDDSDVGSRFTPEK